MKKQPKNVGINPIGTDAKNKARQDAFDVLAIAKKQNRPVIFLRKNQ
ncbi:hypothetical protein [Epilithonimonas mollis]|uniref:Uncharacterized protein n=1 Tax=Epilithonimonas mollis TaxID=216903 RepID=A0A1M6UJ54_9FLAO|nr:hypothetical protein [Epilithonimonas mollis]SHK69265.1 hypothetical protein SAMN05444371_3323 [Epilithonimonas mollis]